VGKKKKNLRETVELQGVVDWLKEIGDRNGDGGALAHRLADIISNHGLDHTKTIGVGPVHPSKTIIAAIRRVVPSLGSARLTRTAYNYLRKAALEIREVGYSPEDVLAMPSIMVRYDWYKEMTVGTIVKYIHEAAAVRVAKDKLKKGLSVNLPPGSSPGWIRDWTLRKTVEASGFSSLTDKEQEAVLQNYDQIK